MEIRKLEIRRLNEEEISHALKLVWEVFEQEIKPSYTEEGVQEFLKFIDYNFIKEAYDKREMIFWGAFEEELIGTIVVRPDGHICLFFVQSEYQGMGIGKALFQMMYNYCVEELHVKKITVNAAPQSVAKYIHMGLRQMGNLEEKNGIRSVPMEMYASPTLVKPVRFDANKKKNRKRIIMILAVILVVLISGVVFTGVRIAKNIYSFVMEEEYQQDLVPEDRWNGESDDSVSIPGELSGVEAIEAYQADNLSYEISNEIYSFVDDEKINTVIDFHIQYPQIDPKNHSMKKEVADNINARIKNCAMATVDEIYLNPTEEIKEKVLSSNQPILVSYLTYKITYQSEKLISIVMEEQSYKGTQQDYYYDFRTLNIDLTDGSVYEVKDIVEIDDAFIKDWIMVMRSEADNGELLSELNKKELKKALKGDSLEGVYDVEFFFDKEGIEIGFTFDYEEGDENDAGYAWVTAPFSYKEIEKYTTDSSIWDEIN